MLERTRDRARAVNRALDALPQLGEQLDTTLYRAQTVLADGKKAAQQGYVTLTAIALVALIGLGVAVITLAALDEHLSHSH